MQILRDLYKLSGEQYRRVTNVYGIRWEKGMILIDCGTDETDLNMIQETMKYWGINDLPITHILITHAHYDHAGNAAVLQKKGAIVIAGEKQKALEKADDPRNFYYAFGEKFPPVKPDRYVRDGESFTIGDFLFDAFEMPGHTVGDVVYRVKMYGKDILFLGDVIHIKEYGEGAWIGDQWFIDSDYDAYMRSLYRLKDLHADVLITGHMQECLSGANGILRDAFVKAQEQFDGRWNKKEFLEKVIAEENNS